MESEGSRTISWVHSICSTSRLFISFALVLSPPWCSKTMNWWFEQYWVLVCRTSIPCTLELVYLRSARNWNVLGILKKMMAKMGKKLWRQQEVFILKMYNGEMNRKQQSTGKETLATQALLYRTFGKDRDQWIEWTRHYIMGSINPKPYLCWRYPHSSLGIRSFNFACSETSALKESGGTVTYPTDESLYLTNNHR